MSVIVTPDSPNLAIRTAPIQEVFSSVQGEGIYVGKRQVFVRFAHCHLKCAYCDTPMQSVDGLCHIETEPGQGHDLQLPNPLAGDALMVQIKNLLDKIKTHSVSFTGGEPLLYHGFLKQVFPSLQPLTKTYLETSGTQASFLAEVLPWTDIIAMDIKLPSATKEADQFDAHQAFYQLARQQPNTEIFIKLIFNETSTFPGQELDAVRSIVTDPSTTIILQPETSLADRSVTISTKRLAEIESALSEYFTDVRVIPQTHKMLKVL